MPKRKLSTKPANVKARQRYLVNKLKKHSHMGPAKLTTKKGSAVKSGSPHHYIYKLLKKFK